MKKIWEDIALGHYREIESSGATTIKSAKMLQIFLQKYKSDHYDITKVKGPLKRIAKSGACGCCYDRTYYRLCRPYLLKLIQSGQVVPSEDTDPKLFEQLRKQSTPLKEKHKILELFFQMREPCWWEYWKPQYLVTKVKALS